MHLTRVPSAQPACLALLALLALLGASLGCGASRPAQPTTPTREVVEMEELRITASRGEGGAYEFAAYDAAELFKRGTELLNQQKCREAVVLYDKLAAEFHSSRFAPSALYNAGLCLQALGDFAPSAERFSALRERYPEHEDRKDGSFQLAEVLVQLERWQDTEALGDELLARNDLTADERLEAMARRAQALLGQQRFDEAESYARAALQYGRTRPVADAINDDFFRAACNYVLAETYRQREQSLDFPEGLEPQKEVLLRRAQLLLEAQREYFNTIHFSNVRWTAASGYRIGHMYDELWHAIMSAPVPPHLPPEGHPIYRQELAKLIKPLVRHAIRYWEVTLLLLERTGFQSEWTTQTRADLERVRSLLLEQPEGAGGLPPPNGPQPVPGSPGATTAAPPVSGVE
jgi:tetratricopeptide (TPR) repeat protein